MKYISFYKHPNLSDSNELRFIYTPKEIVPKKYSWHACVSKTISYKLPKSGEWVIETKYLLICKA